jgi:DNA-nicking Smr family endonuclease
VPLKQLGELERLRQALLERGREQARNRAEQARLEAEVERKRDEFEHAMRELGGVRPLTAPGRRPMPRPSHPPRATSREADERAVLGESLSDGIDPDTLLETDDQLSWRRPGLGPDVINKLRRGHWSTQAEVDLHGHRVDEARAALSAFLHEAARAGVRCVRVVHGKGLGSRDRLPVLKGKVRHWLTQREEVLAYTQARAADGGSGALIVLLAPAERRPGRSGP